MIRGIHGLLYSSDPEATRRFFREKVRLPGSDVGEGWWIFDFAEGDLGVHPVEESDGAAAGTHDVSFYCDDIERTVKDLASRGVEFTGAVEDQGYGLVTHFTAPGGIRIQLYEPRYVKGSARARKAPVRKPAARAGRANPRKAAARRSGARKRR
jgi:predicted enzyme related to lactoylglutathione lyase